jgi:hypothetical protein
MYHASQISEGQFHQILRVYFISGYRISNQYGSAALSMIAYSFQLLFFADCAKMMNIYFLHVLQRKTLLILLILPTPARSVIKGFPKAASSHKNDFQRAQE